MHKKTNDLKDRRISVGECLDQLLNRDCRFPFEREDTVGNNSSEGVFGGLVCPSMNGSTPGTGNIVIKGSAGTGKSTLALQIAVEAARRNAGVCTAYISLEETPQQILAKASMFGWKNWLTPLTIRTDNGVDQETSRKTLTADLSEVLRQISFKCPNLTNDKEINADNHKCHDCHYKNNDAKNECEYCLFVPKNKRACPVKAENKRNTICGGDCGLQFGNHVLLPSLETRVFEPSDSYEKHDMLFKIRMNQLEDLLSAACELNDNAERERKGKRLDIVCLDSLNVFGQGHLTRDHLSALFALFRRYRVIGVFVYEQLEHDHLSGRFDHSLKDIEFLADTVIDLTGGEFQGYWVRHLHISKSRHQHQVLGRHPFKIIEDESRNQIQETDSKSRDLRPQLCPHLITTQTCPPAENKEIRISRFGIRVFPSIHTVIRSSKKADEKDKRANINDAEKVFFQDSNLNKIGGPALVKQGPAVATVYGPAVAGKRVLAFNFLLQGLIDRKNGILITLGETCIFDSGSAALGFNNEIKEDREEKKDIINFSLENLLTLKLDSLPSKVEKNACRVLHYVSEHHKVTFAVWRCKYSGKRKDPLLGKDNYIIEMALKPGTLLPEEVTALVRHVYGALTLMEEGGRNSDNWPKRAVLQNVNRIGFSYPFLREATTGPELFLPGLTHLFHCRGTDLLITAQTGGIAASDNITKQAVSLADAALECSHLDVFGDRYVTITGPGLIENDTHRVNSPEGVPGVLREDIREEKCGIGSFSLDMNALSDLVGFATGDIRRPGVLLQLFEEGGLHQKYNHQVKRLVQFAMGDPMRHDGRNTSDTARVQIDTFDSREASAFHRSLSLLSGAPLSKTVIRTVDEFAYTDHVAKIGVSLENTDVRRSKPSGRYENVYYRNMLLFLCDDKTYDELRNVKATLEETRLGLQLIVGFNALNEIVKDAKLDIQKAAIRELVSIDADNYSKWKALYNCIMDMISKAENSKDKNNNPGIIESVGKLKSLLMSQDFAINRGKHFSVEAPDKSKRYDDLLFKIIDRLDDSELEDELLGDYRKSALEFWKILEELTGSTDVRHTAFLYDERARETLASLTLDGILSLAGCHRGELDLEKSDTNVRVVTALLKESSLGKKESCLGKWVAHITAVMENAKPLLLNENQDKIEETTERKDKLTNEVKEVFSESKRFILLAWYSHIRELIDLIYQDNKLGLNLNAEFMKGLKVLPLPAGGVKGDWYLQAPQGSVSISLGRKIRRQMLDPVEDFNRFTAGVGLPCWPRSDSEFEETSQTANDDLEIKYSKDRFYKLKRYSEELYPKLMMAWPGSDVSLQTVLSLHRFAHRRSDIIGYEKIHDELFTIMEDIILRSKRRDGGDVSSVKNHEEMIINVIQRLKMNA